MMSVALPGGAIAVVSRDPNHVKIVFNKPDIFGLNQNFSNAFASVSPQGLLILEGDIWKRHRKLVQVRLLSFEPNFLP